MIISLLVLGSPYSSQSVHSALRFATAATHKGHNLYRVFFYHDAVNTGNQLIAAPQDELQLPDTWATLSQQYDIDLVVCIASALKHGVIDATEASRYDKPACNLQATFNLSGLGQWVDAILVSDRVVSFGP